MNAIHLREMFALQNSMNSKVNPDWRAAGYPFLRAIVVEGAEAMEHHGWKWWKAQTADVQQLRIELVDIWHFMLSAILIENSGNIEASVQIMLADKQGMFEFDAVTFDRKIFQFGAMDCVRKIEVMIGLAVSRRYSVSLFESIMDDVAMDWPTLFRLYVGKNVLNFFRQDNGYKQGTYVKIWDGQEDNVALEELMKSTPLGENFQAELYAALGKRYALVYKGPCV